MIGEFCISLSFCVFRLGIGLLCCKSFVTVLLLLFGLMLAISLPSRAGESILGTLVRLSSLSNVFSCGLISGFRFFRWTTAAIANSMSLKNSKSVVFLWKTLFLWNWNSYFSSLQLNLVVKKIFRSTCCKKINALELRYFTHKFDNTALRPINYRGIKLYDEYLIIGIIRIFFHTFIVYIWTLLAT